MPEGWLPTALPLLLQKMHGRVLRKKGDSNPKHRDSTCSLKRNFPKACRKRGVLMGKTSKRWKYKLSVFWFLQRVKRKRNFKQWSAEICFCLIYRLEKTTCILLKALFPMEIHTNRRGADPQILCLSLSLIHSCFIISLTSSTVEFSSPQVLSYQEARRIQNRNASLHILWGSLTTCVENVYFISAELSPGDVLLHKWV